MNFVAYNWTPAVALPRMISIRLEMAEFISFVELVDNFDLLLARVITAFDDGLLFVGEGEQPGYSIHVSNGPVHAPIVSLGSFSLAVILADSSTILRAAFEDDSRHLIIWKSEGEGVNQLVHVVVGDELLQQTVFNAMHGLFPGRIIRFLDNFDGNQPIASLFPEHQLVS